MLTTVVSILSGIVLVCLGWAFTLSSKVAVLEKTDEDYKEFMNALLDAKFAPINQRLARIEGKLWNGSSLV